MKFFERFIREVKGGPWQIIMIGGPGSGKSTYSKYITKHFDIPHIYTGDMMRALAKKDTPDGKRVKELLANGKFAPTEIVMREVMDRLKKPDAKNGYVFDGFPRNMEQVESMDKNNIEHNFIINLQVSEEEVIKRLTARGRADDKPETIKQRLKEHEKQVGPVIKHYNDQLINIKAEGAEPEVIANKIIKRIEQ
jgi:adenylate kinase